MGIIKINGKEYKIKEINFGALRELEKVGFNINTLKNLTENYWGALSSLVAFTIDDKQEVADKEIESHIANGGSIDDFAPLFDSITDSDFFRNLSK